MATRTKLQEIHPVNFEKFDSWKISESLANSMIFVVDDQGPPAHGITTVPHFPLKYSNIKSENKLLLNISKMFCPVYICIPLFIAT